MKNIFSKFSTIALLLLTVGVGEVWGRSFDGATYLYFQAKPASCNWWWNDQLPQYVWFKKGSTETETQTAQVVDGSIHRILVPEGDWTEMKIQRGTHNLTGYITIDATKNYLSNGIAENATSGTWSVYDPDACTFESAPSEVLSDTNVMFYFTGYSGRNQLSEGSKGSCENYSVQIGNSATSYISIAKTNLNTYKCVSNNCSNWGGKENPNIPEANGGELFITNETVSKTAATTAATTVSVAGGTLSISTTASSATGTYDNLPLYIQYYLDGSFIGVTYNAKRATYCAIKASTSEIASTYDVSGLSEGTYKLKTVLTDGNIFYIADEDDFEVVSALGYSLIVAKGTGISSVEGGQAGQASVPFDGTITATPATGYDFAGWTASPAANAEFVNAANDSTTVRVKNGSVTVTANATEHMNTIMIVGGTKASTTAGIATKGTATAAAPAGKRFTGWTIPGSNFTLSGCSVSDQTITFTATADGTVTANYEDVTEYAFIQGRFHVQNEGRTQWTNTFSSGDWDEGSTKIRMIWDNENNRYYLNTYATPKELTNQISGHNPYFYIKTSTSSSRLENVTSYQAQNAHTYIESAGEANKIELVTTNPGNANLRFNSQDESGYVTIYFDKRYIWYELTCSLKYDGNGNTGGTAPSGTTVVKGNEVVVAGNTGSLSKSGYTFSGWNTASDGNGTDYAVGDSIIVNQNTTLYAKWTEIRYEVSFNNDGNGTTTPNGATEIGIVPVAISATPNGGYAFDHWEVTGGARVDNPSVASTTVTATAAGTVTAHFAHGSYVTFGKIGEGTINAAVAGSAISSGDFVANAANVVFTAIPNSGYQVEGWYTDEDCLYPISEGISTSNATNDTYTISGLSDEATVYVRFYAPATVSGITLKDEMDQTTLSFCAGEQILAVPTVSGGIGAKAYCWTLRDSEGNPIAQTFKSKGSGKVAFSVNKLGRYTLTLTIYDTDCNGAQNSTFTTGSFTIRNHEYYIVGDAFWGVNQNDYVALKPSSTNSDGINVYFRPTLEEGEYVFGPMKFTNYSGRRYLFFGIYDKAKNTHYAGVDGSNYWISTTNNSKEHPITLVPSSYNFRACDEDGNNWTLYSRDYYLYIRNGQIWVSTEGPDMNPKTRLKIEYTRDAINYTVYSNEVKMPAEGVQSPTISFYAPALNEYGCTSVTYTMQQQEPGAGWTTSGIVLSANPSIPASGVYTATYTQTTADGVSTVTIGQIAKYTGNYYVRSSALAGGWDNYLDNKENLMRITDRAKDNRFDRFVCKWCNNTRQNVRCCIANDYNPNISYTLVGDEIIGNGNETLQDVAANVRFSWNSVTNKLYRAYLEGTISDSYLVLMSDDNHDKVYDAKVDGNLISTLKFTDLQDWEYTVAEVYAEPGAMVAVRAKYGSKYQYFFGTGAVDSSTPATYEYLLGDAEHESNTRYKMRIIYDFKVDRLVCGWVPENAIDEDMMVNADVLIIREHNKDANVVEFNNPDHKLTDVKTVYGVLQLNKAVMTAPYTGVYPVVRQMYWVSFPFNVRVRDIFGISGYGKNWRVLKYNGEKRARIGWFMETETFWEEMAEDEIMEANRGYVINLSRSYFRKTDSEVWGHGIQSVSLYFPSMSTVGTIKQEAVDVTVHTHECTIDRTFEVDGTVYNHKITDSNWNIIGLPLFQQVVGNGKLTTAVFYQWQIDSINNDQVYTATDGTGFTFKPTVAYMVQFGGELNWTQGATPQILAPKRNSANTNDYTLDIRLTDQDNEMLDRTYVKLKDDAVSDFVLNEDLYKIQNPRFNIYTRTSDGYRTGSNVLPIADDTIDLGITVAGAQDYKIRLNSVPDCDVELIDKVLNVTTNLNTSDYSVYMESGNHPHRFALVVKTSRRIYTDFESTVDTNEKYQKFIENGQLMIQHGTHIYDAQGRMLK